jgi:hypothetical protein
VLAHVGGQDLVIERTASVSEARRVVRDWQRFWEENGADFSPLDGPHRLAAMVKETAYGRWLGSMLRGEFGTTRDGGTGLDLLRPTLLPTLLRYLTVVLLGSLLGAVAVWQGLGRPGLLPRLLRAAALLLASVPVLALVRPLGSGSGAAAAGLAILVLWQAALVMLHAASTPTVGLLPRFERAFTLVSPGASLFIGVLLALECLLGLRGLGPVLRGALAREDLHAVMAVTLTCALFAASGMLLSDGLQALLRRRQEAAARD